MSQRKTVGFPAARTNESVEVDLRNGGVAGLRPLGHGESAPLLAVFEQMSHDSRALRYLTGLPRLPRAMVSMLSDVDGDLHVAWMASVSGQPAGIARYVRLPGCTTTAEIAFEVVDEHQGRGLGTVLLDTITTVAAARGVRRVRGTMAPSNTTSRRLIDRVLDIG